MAVGRFAPTPTGALHVGNLRTALVAWLSARAAGSRFVLRVDDLDPSDAHPGHEAGQLADLAALGLDWDGPPLRQSTRGGVHAEAVEALVAADRTYPCWCSRKEVREATAAPHGAPGRYPGTCRRLSCADRAERMSAGRPAALRLDARGEVVTLVDRWQGAVSAAVDDVVVRRNDGLVAYHVACVVDDAHQGVEEVVRGADLLESTPAQVLLARLLGLGVVAHAHVPLVVATDGTRLAKRHGAVTLGELAATGVGPDEVRSRLAASLGLAAQNERVAPDMLVGRFDPATLPLAPWAWPGPW